MCNFVKNILNEFLMEEVKPYTSEKLKICCTGQHGWNFDFMPQGASVIHWGWKLAGK
jgi:hypothetical protein